jgi:hypothetical protein
MGCGVGDPPNAKTIKKIKKNFACAGQVKAEVIFLALSQFTESFRRMLRQRGNDFPSTDSTRSGTGSLKGNYIPADSVCFRIISALTESTRGLQRDVVYLG